MEPERRERLIEKREALKAKRKLESRLRSINDITQYLNRHKIEYRIHLEHEQADKALHSDPAYTSSLNWDEIFNSKKLTYHSFTERDEIISTVITDYLEVSDTTFVIWNDGYKPTLEIAANLVAEHADAIADEDSRMWVLNVEKGFCLEHRHGAYILEHCYGGYINLVYVEN